MDRGDFIIAVFLVVCEHYQVIKKQHRLRRSGFAPTLSDGEVITIEICGEYFKLECDKDIFAYFHKHYLHFFPKLTERSLFVRQVANLWQVKAAIQKRLVVVSGQANDPVQVIDTLPLPVCVLTRAVRDHCFEMEADFGYCAAKDLHYYGFKLGLRISRLGMITPYPLLEGFEGMAPADKGFIDECRQSLLLERHRILVATPARKNMQRTCQNHFANFASVSGSLLKQSARI